jgi:hypothetical protein
VGEVVIVDIEGAARAFVAGVPGLTGPGAPLANGAHIGRPRSPARGAIAAVELLAPRTPDDIADTARISFAVSAVGAGSAGRQAARIGCEALARAVLSLQGAPVVVQTLGGPVRILAASDPQGPTWTGDQGGEATYRLDVTFTAQAG